MKRLLRVAGMLALASVVLWAFTGVPVWASVEGNPGRGYVLACLHITALAGWALSYAP